MELELANQVEKANTLRSGSSKATNNKCHHDTICSIDSC